MQIRRAVPADADAIWSLLKPVIREGETYPLDRDMTQDQAIDYWLAAEVHSFVAEMDGRIVGTYILRTNQRGGGRHVCNCSYVSDAAAAGKGIARSMHASSVAQAQALGYRAMQFNFVIATNERAVRLWQYLGFAIVGRLPAAFDHPTKGFVDALVMFKNLV